MDEQNDDNGTVIITKVYGDVCIRKNRRKRQRALAREILHDYAKNTTLHGLSYTTKSGVTLGEKIFWLITFIISLCLCIYLIHNVWIKWQTSPVIVTISEALVPVTQIPFPSITICLQSKVKTSIYEYSEQLDLFVNSGGSDGEILDKFFDVALICEDSRFYNKLHNNTEYNNVIFTRNRRITEELISVAPKKDDIFVACIWRGRTDLQCAKTVTEVMTSEGLCYNINSLATDNILQKDHNIFSNAKKSAVNWTMEGGYSSFGPNVYPTPGKEFGASPDLEIVFQDNHTERDPLCNYMNTGFNKVYIQHPTDFPQPSQHYYAVRNGQLSSLALSFNIINTSKTLEKYTAETRQCYFAKDRPLKYFKIYTASNCMMECFINVTGNMCNCTTFYMPHKNDTRICQWQDENCVNAAREELANTEQNNITKQCKCLPSCYSVEYSAVILKSPFKFVNLLEANVTKNYTGIEYSKLEIYYKSPRFVSMHRSELFGITDLLAYTGGLLGLFLGFSFLSLIELIYFLTIRLLVSSFSSEAMGLDCLIEVISCHSTIDNIIYQ